MPRLKKPESTPIHLNSALWKALGSIVSTDDTRPNITHIHARDARTWEATDGHCAVQVTFDADTELAPGLYNPKVTLARIKASVLPESTNPNTRDTWEYPNIDQVMPKACEGFTERADASFNPALLSRVCDAVNGILCAVSGAAHAGVTVDLSDDLSPALVYGKVPGAFVRAAVMPMRVNGPRTRPEKDTFDADALKAAEKRTAYLDSVVAELRDEVIRLTNELNEAREAADTDAADAVRAHATVDELRAEVNTLRHLRPKAIEMEPVLLTRPIVRA